MTTTLLTDRLTLAERQSTHGDFECHAAVTQDIKVTISHHVENFGQELTDMQKEALDMIAHKIGRIIAGNPNHHDHWHDIAGYASLVADKLRRT